MACDEKNPLSRDGSSQTQRFLQALDPSSAPIEELGMREWMQFAIYYAAHVNYFTTADSDHHKGDWTPFFIDDGKPLDDFLTQVKIKMQNAALDAPDTSILSDIQPHLALFLCFLLLMQHSADLLNQITGKHLDFYFKRVLQLRNRDEVPDKVHVIFELAKNLTGYLLPKNTLLDAGKDQSTKPRPLVYETNSELAVNAAAIAALKSLYCIDSSKKVLYADVTNSMDGLGTPIKDDVPKWNAFGNDNWPAATMGFAVASKVLLLSEGDRTITLTLNLNSSPGNVSEWNTLFKVFLTSEKDWLQADLSTPFGSSGSTLIITVIVPAKAKAVIPYDKTIHHENYNTDLPVLRLLVQAQDGGYDAYKALAGIGVNNLRIDVDVKNMKNLAVENDNGPVDPSKPFAAFGAQPLAGSNLYIGSAEIFQKDWSNITTHITWKGLPDLKNNYTCYRKDYIASTFTRAGYTLTSDDDTTGSGRVVSSANYFTADVYFLLGGQWTKGTGSAISLFPGNNSELEIDLTPNGATQPWDPSFYINKLMFFTYASYSGYARQTEKAVAEKYTRSKNVYQLGFAGFSGVSSGLQTQNTALTAVAKDNFFKLALNQDFMHSVYPQIYAAAMANTAGNVLVPKEPYTPQVASLTVDYKATAQNDLNDLFSKTDDDLLGDYLSRNIQFFHETPFGQKEQHLFLKKQLAGVSQIIYNSGAIKLMPPAPEVADFYIGISGIAVGSVISMLFQVAEGSEDPAAPTFSDKILPTWYFLSGNEWLQIKKTNIVSDDTNNFLRPGILRILIPDGTTTTNSYLNQGYTWLRVTLPKEVTIDSVCKFITVLSQADQAVFADQDNELSHLQNGIAAGTISKLVNRLPQIKTVSQPFASFGGAMPEDDKAFRIRVSERLRHKHRAVNIWDYERLVLAQFPQIYRAKCLNHTYIDQTTYCEVSPGCVRIAVIPDTKNKNAFDPFKPRASANTLSEIENYLSGLIGLHVDMRAINPDYDEVTLDFKVKFYDGLDENLYHDVLNTDLVNYLSPWAYNQEVEVDFGGTLYKSVVIRFIEELPYVDYITDFRMYFTGSPANPDVLTAKQSNSILVSATVHQIDFVNVEVCS